jgi:hypothetical protein
MRDNSKGPDVLKSLGLTEDEVKALDLGADRLVGAREIARFRNEPVERTRYLIKQGVIKTYKEGATIISSRYALNKAHLMAMLGQQTGEAA